MHGKDIDELLTDAEDYIKRIKKLFEQIQKRRDKESIDEIYESCLSLVSDALKVNELTVNDKSKLVSSFKKHLVDDKKIFSDRHLETLKLVIDTKNSYATKKIAWPELEKIRREARGFIKSVVEYVQRKKGYELDRAKIRFKYGDKFGEALLLDGVAYVVHDVEAQDKEISKTKIKDDGSFSDLEKSNLEELEKEVMKVTMPKKVFIKEKTFESLKKLFGKDIEILVNY